MKKIISIDEEIVSPDLKVKVFKQQLLKNKSFAEIMRNHSNCFQHFKNNYLTCTGYKAKLAVILFLKR